MEDAEDSESDSGEAEGRWDEEGRIVTVIVVVTLRWDWEEKERVCATESDTVGLAPDSVKLLQKNADRKRHSVRCCRECLSMRQRSCKPSA
jgi:hypothetical protein